MLNSETITVWVCGENERKDHYVTQRFTLLVHTIWKPSEPTLEDRMLAMFPTNVCIKLQAVLKEIKMALT